MTNDELEFLSNRLITKMKNGDIRRDSLSNHGEEFEGDGEELAIRRYKNYLYSASYIINGYIRENKCGE